MAIGSTHSEHSGTVALLAAGISAAAIALTALLGWVVDAPALTAWGADTIPMAPSTAALAAVFGAAIGLCNRMPPRRGAVRLATILAAVGTMAALLLFALRLRGVYWPAEHLGLQISGTLRGAPIGYISPITAFCFLLGNAALLTVLSPGARGSSRRRWLSRSVGGLISVMGFALLLAHAFGAPLLFRDAFIPPAFNTSLILLIVGLALLVLAGRLTVEPRVSPERAPKGRLVFVVILVGFAAATIAGGYGYYRQEEQELRKEAESQLEIVAKLKVNGVSQWREERLADATVMLHSSLLSASFEHFLQTPGDAAMVGQIQDWLGSYQAHGQYDRAFLIDAQGATRLSLLPAEPPSSAIVRQAVEVLRTGQVALQDFYLDERDQRVHLAILAPILAQSGSRRPIGVLVLRIDPESFLYPFIEGWPTTSTTAEALLVRRDGADVLYLSRLRFDPNAALHRRMPLENARVLAVRAVLGQTGAVDGLDYRGVAVLGALHPIPDSPWYLVARIDITEFRAQLRDQLRLAAAVTIVLLLGGGLGLSLIGRSQRIRFYQKQAELAAELRESEERLRLTLRAADQGLYDLNVQTGEAVVSSEYATMLGYDPAEFHETKAAWIERMHPDDREAAVAADQDYIAGRRDEYSVEFRQRTKSGDWKWILSLGKLVSRAAGGQPLRMLGTHTDVTARKVAEIRSQRLAQLYAALSQCNQAIVRCVNEADLFPQICRDTVVFGGLKMAWIGLVDEASQQVRPVASYGEGVEYLEGIRVSVDVHDPFGRGLVGGAIRDNQPVWCQDFLHDPRTAPWRERAERFEWTATAALPLRRQGRPIGAFTLYSSTVGAFDEDIRALLMEMATDISFALDNFAREAARRQAEEALRTSLREKEALLKEVHHRVKNNLQVITSLLRLEAGRSAHPATAAVLGEMQSRIQSMALLHETLYRSGNFAQVDLSVYLTQLATQLFRSVAPPSGAIALHLDLASVLVDLDQAVPCGLLVNELVSNCLKHGFPDGRTGEVRIELQPVDELARRSLGEGGQLRLQVSDTGVGLPADFEQRRAGSLGLQLVADLARQLHGTLDIGRGPGAVFGLAFTPRTSAALRSQEK